MDKIRAVSASYLIHNFKKLILLIGRWRYNDYFLQYDFDNLWFNYDIEYHIVIVLKSLLPLIN